MASDRFPSRSWLRSNGHGSLLTYWLRRWLVPGFAPTPSELVECEEIKARVLSQLDELFEGRTASPPHEEHLETQGAPWSVH